MKKWFKIVRKNYYGFSIQIRNRWTKKMIAFKRLTGNIKDYTYKLIGKSLYAIKKIAKTYNIGKDMLKSYDNFFTKQREEFKLLRQCGLRRKNYYV